MSSSLPENEQLTIGALAAQTNTSVAAIRYYEQIGLLPRPRRASNGHRHYREADLKRLGFIRRCRDFGFPIEEVRELVELFEDGDRACIEARNRAQAHLDSVRDKLQELRQLEAGLAGFVASCDETCAAGTTRDCLIIEDLSIASALPASAQCCAPPPAAQQTGASLRKKKPDGKGKRK